MTPEPTSKALLTKISNVVIYSIVLCFPCSAAWCLDNKTDPVSSAATTSSLQTYMTAVTLKIRKAWIPIASSAPRTFKLHWIVARDGSISKIAVTGGGLSTENEKRACEQVQKCSPLPPLPAGAPENVDIEFTFTTVLYPPPLGLTVKQAIDKFGPPARKLLVAKFKSINQPYPPAHLSLIGLKKERVLLLYADTVSRSPKFIASFPLVSFSGTLGPKLKEGDLQIPEGIYRITNEQAHARLALGVDYPNKIDRRRAALEHRTNVGGNILVHGGFLSTGCLVVSNDDMKQIFTAVNDVGCSNTELLIAPSTLPLASAQAKDQPKWVPDLYKDIARELKRYPLPPIPAKQ